MWNSLVFPFAALLHSLAGLIHVNVRFGHVRSATFGVVDLRSHFNSPFDMPLLRRVSYQFWSSLAVICCSGCLRLLYLPLFDIHIAMYSLVTSKASP